jgi:hypothetical protein
MDPVNVFDDSSDEDLEEEESDLRQEKRRIAVKALLVYRFLPSRKKSRRAKRSNFVRNRRVSHALLQEGISPLDTTTSVPCLPTLAL